MNDNDLGLNFDKDTTKMIWRFWAKWEGIDYEKAYFDLEGMNELDPISYNEYKKRLYHDH